MPADIDRIHLARARLTGEDSLDSGRLQRETDSARAQDERALDAVSGHDFRRYAGRREHLLIGYGQSELAQLGGLLRWRIRAAIRQHDERDRSIFQCREHLGGARQQFIAAERPVAEQQRAVEIEHVALDRRQSF